MKETRFGKFFEESDEHRPDHLLYQDFITLNPWMGLQDKPDGKMVFYMALDHHFPAAVKPAGQKVGDFGRYLKVKRMTWAITVMDYEHSQYATWIKEGLKTIETRKFNWSGGQLLIICGKGSIGVDGERSPNAGKAVALVRVGETRDMTQEDEPDAMCMVYSEAKAWPFEEVFRVKGDVEIPGFQGIRLIEMPEIELEPVKRQNISMVQFYDEMDEVSKYCWYVGPEKVPGASGTFEAGGLYPPKRIFYSKQGERIAEFSYVRVEEVDPGPGQARIVSYPI